MLLRAAMGVYVNAVGTERFCTQLAGQRQQVEPAAETTVLTQAALKLCVASLAGCLHRWLPLAHGFTAHNLTFPLPAPRYPVVIWNMLVVTVHRHSLTFAVTQWNR